jgi:hypothetical protein
MDELLPVHFGEGYGTSLFEIFSTRIQTMGEFIFLKEIMIVHDQRRKKEIKFFTSENRRDICRIL